MDAVAARVLSLEAEMLEPNFWQRAEARAMSEELGEKKETVERYHAFVRDLEGVRESMDVAAKFPDDTTLQEELVGQLAALEGRLREEELTLALGGTHDRASALLTVMSGAGGRDAEDWAAMLARMYQRYSEARGWTVRAVWQSFGEESGLKTGTMEVKGKFAYGYLKGEAGVHRLVRISPFSPQKLRHTSFAKVEVLPEIGRELESEIKISPEEIKIDTYHSSGAGGQNVNKRESAIRITHLPTGIVVNCQSERAQAQNKERALNMLRAKLYQLKEEQALSDIAELKTKEAAEWGHQRRSYVLQPYRLVKDVKTGVETSDVDGVLDGKIEAFIEGNLQIELRSPNHESRKPE
ncbi:MAG: peptide chain release factor 2 [bacterium]|nr:peptide chain release factor 2 [bacterium]